MRKIIFLLMLLLIIPLSSSDSTIPNWYEVESWEIDVCSMYGGTATAQQSEAAVSEGTGYMYLTTVTIQAQKSNSSGIEIYEVAWYFRPMDADQVYKIQLIGLDGTIEIYTATATVELGDASYIAVETNKDYEKAKIIYETGSLMVPVIKND